MRKFIVLAGVTQAIVIASTPLVSLADTTSVATFPPEVRASLQAALNTGDAFVIKSVASAITVQYPSMAAKVAALTSGIEAVDSAEVLISSEVEEAPALADISPAAGGGQEASPRNWKVNVEAGLLFQTGNTEKEDYSLSTVVEHDFDQWANTLTVKAASTKENQKRASEEYRILDQARYKLSDIDYAFAELEYVNDRFSGYNYRVSENIGYGRVLYKTDDLGLTGEISAGMRQSEQNGEDMENSVLGKVSAKANWDISEGLKLTEDLSVAVASDSIITNSNTALKTQLSEKLYLKLGLDIEHISDVPDGRENIDTKTMLTIGYEL